MPIDPTQPVEAQDAPDATPPTRRGPTAAPRIVTPHHEPPESVVTAMDWQGRQVTATGAWTVLRRAESPAAEVFTTSYVLEPVDADRPVTFVFNGGPGASSAYLHMGGVGPRRVALPDDGGLPTMPVRVVDNEDAWLDFTDLVFIDPVGTGFSRLIPEQEDGGGGPDGERSGPGYLTFATDLAAMAETISRWLSRTGRWTSPTFIAGESYGGYRVARMAKTLQQDEGVGLAGAMMISPAIELAPLSASDYSLESFIDVVPTMAASALHHGRSRAASQDDDVDAVMATARQFACGPYVQLLAQGAAMPEAQRGSILSQLADLVGLPLELVQRHHGRLTAPVYVRELLRDQQRVVGLYDTTVETQDPFPDRDAYAGPDATLHSFNAAFATAANHVLRTEIGVDTERRYEVLSMDVNRDWRADDGQHALSTPPGAADDMRYGLALNPHLRIMLTHGRHDLITPTAGSRRVLDRIGLTSDLDRVSVHDYDGGHMYYARAESRRAWTRDTADFVARCLGT